MPHRSGGATFRTANIFVCLTLLLTIFGLLTILGSSTVQAQLTNNNVNTPGPSGGARLGNNFFIYARHAGNNTIVARKTDGITSANFTITSLPAISTNCYPAAATIYNASLIPTKIAILARRSTDGHILVTLTSTGESGFSGWADIGAITDAAPTAAWFKPSTGNGVLVVAYRNSADQGFCYYKYSADGITWSVPVRAFGSKVMSSAPTLLVQHTLRNAAEPFILQVYYKGPSNVIYHHTTTNPTVVSGGTGFGNPSSGGLSYGSYTSRTVTSPGTQTQDPTLTSAVGTCIVENDPTSWGAYNLEQIVRMRAGVVKFQCTYNARWGAGAPANHDIRYSDIVNAIDAGAKTIVLRTAETRTSASDIATFMGSMYFLGSTVRIADLPNLYPTTTGVEFVIEVGNEPDHAFPAVGAAVARNNALAVAAQVKPIYPEFRWIVSLPTAWPPGTPSGGFNYSYLSTFLSTTTDGKTVLSEYQGAAAHIYANNNLAWSNTGEQPLNVLEYLLARLPYGKMIHVSEVGLNSRTVDWATKGLRYKNAMYAAPSCVRAWEFFCTSAHPNWNTFTYYCMDKAFSDKQVTAVVPGAAPYAHLAKVTIAATATFPTGLPANWTTTTWAANDSIYLKNVVLGTNPANPGNDISGGYTVLGPPNAPAPTAGVFYINRNVTGLGTIANRPTGTGPGFADRYPLCTLTTFPAAAAISAR